MASGNGAFTYLKNGEQVSEVEGLLFFDKAAKADVLTYTRNGNELVVNFDKSDVWAYSYGHTDADDLEQLKKFAAQQRMKTGA